MARRRRRHTGPQLISRHRGFNKRELARIRARIRRDAQQGGTARKEEGSG